MVRAWVGWAVCLFFYVGFWVRPSMVLNQKLSIVVPDWESYLGSLGFTFGLWGFVFHVSTTRDCLVHFTFIVLYFVVFSLCSKINIMDTYHAANWSSDPSRFSSSWEEDEIRYTMLWGEMGVPVTGMFVFLIRYCISSLLRSGRVEVLHPSTAPLAFGMRC